MAFTPEQVERRRGLVPGVTYPDLPVSERRDDIAAAIRDHQVVVVAGETGSGKTTQLPKICLELGRGVNGLIGHTQPRRIAARAVAERVAEELGRPLGSVVGYQVRFTHRTGEDTLVKVMTDGVLLAEIAHDRLLSRYDTLILDEAHERSLTIDFLLGYLKQLLPRRPDLRVVITSATIDPARFAAHFGDAPVIEVSGRTYPVEVRYRPLIEDSAVEGSGERDQVQGICDALVELGRETPGDVLVFLSGEREIRDTAEAVRALQLRDTEVLPLYGRLSAAEQHRVFTPHTGRRVVLATNVAETSLTVPGIRYVVDPGSARISRYSNRTKVQRLPIEAISQASADQRKGRCGRQADGICIRLYTEEDYLARPRYTEPEILRTSLASVLLQMAALDLGDVQAFPFLDPPDSRQVRDGVQLLEELGALAFQPPSLTPLGRRLARLPVDPRLGRMVLEAEGNGCLREVLVIAAALSIQDPRERPADREAAALQMHARFVDRSSDFLTYLNLWDYLQEQQAELSSSAFRRMCRAEFLHYLRVREWQDLVAQLRQAARSVGARVRPRDEVTEDVPETERTQADADRIHLSLLAGLLSHVGARDGDTRDYLGARGSRFVLWPGSGLARKPPRFVMAAELVETSRLWGRVVARVEPERVEALAGHLVKRTYSEPHWEKDRGSVVAYEKVTLYGVPLVARRRVAYGGIDPELSRDLFIRNALVEGDWRTHHTFWHGNRERLAEVEELEHRVRRRDVVVDDEALYALYDKRIPADIVSARHFDRWWKEARRTQPDLLTFTVEMLTSAQAPEAAEVDYPDVWRQGDLALPLTYLFEPGAPDDGVCVEVPLAVLPTIDAEDFLWQVPGLREEAVTGLVRSLPKAVRRTVVPAPDRARSALASLRAREEPLLPALERELRRMTGTVVQREDWDVPALPPHLRMTFRVVDDRGQTLAQGKDLAEIRRALAPRVRRTVAKAAASLERAGLRDWTVGDVPRRFAGESGGLPVQGFPAIVDEGDTVALRVLATEREQALTHAAGVRRLLILTLPSPVAPILRDLPSESKLLLARSPYRDVLSLLEDCVVCGTDALMAENGGVPWDQRAFAALRNAVRAELPDRTRAVLAAAERVLRSAQEVERGLTGQSSLALLPSLADIRDQLARLVLDGFVSATGWGQLRELERYVRALALRLDRLPDRPANDATAMATMRRVEGEWHERARTSSDDDGVERVRRMLDELRVSLWAQTLGTAYPVSEKRVLRALDELSD
jgi:ATP-dependent helicase HrpA